MCQKWEGDCGLWVLNEMILKNTLKVFVKENLLRKSEPHKVNLKRFDDDL